MDPLPPVALSITDPSNMLQDTLWIVMMMITTMMLMMMMIRHVLVLRPVARTKLAACTPDSAGSVGFTR